MTLSLLRELRPLFARGLPPRRIKKALLAEAGACPRKTAPRAVALDKTPAQSKAA